MPAPLENKQTNRKPCLNRQKKIKDFYKGFSSLQDLQAFKKLAHMDTPTGYQGGLVFALSSYELLRALL